MTSLDGKFSVMIVHDYYFLLYHKMTLGKVVIILMKISDKELFSFYYVMFTIFRDSMEHKHRLPVF